MAQLMSNGEGGTNSIFLTDGATPVLVAHGPQLRKPYRVTYTHTGKHTDAHKHIQTHSHLEKKKKNLLLEC